MFAVLRARVRAALGRVLSLFGTFCLGPWLDANVDIVRVERLAALSNVAFLGNRDKIMAEPWRSWL